MDQGDKKGIIYIIEAQGKTFLYACDSGPYCQKTADCIAAHRFDAVIMEQTFGYAKKGEYHMDWDHGYWTHMSPHRTPPHEDLEELLKGTAVTPAYDGMKIEL